MNQKKPKALKLKNLKLTWNSDTNTGSYIKLPPFSVVEVLSNKGLTNREVTLNVLKNPDQTESADPSVKPHKHYSYCALDFQENLIYLVEKDGMLSYVV